MNRILLRYALLSTASLAIAATTATAATAAMANSYVFRRPLTETTRAIEAPPPPGEEIVEEDDDGFEADPLVVGGSLLKGRRDGYADLTMYGITVHGGKAPYQISVSGDLPVTPKLFYRAENYGSQALLSTSSASAGLCGFNPGNLLCLYSDVVFGSTFDRTLAYYYDSIDGPNVNQRIYGISGGASVRYTYVEDVSPSCNTGSGSVSMASNEVFEASEVSPPTGGDSVVSHSVPSARQADQPTLVVEVASPAAALSVERRARENLPCGAYLVHNRIIR